MNRKTCYIPKCTTLNKCTKKWKSYLYSKLQETNGSNIEKSLQKEVSISFIGVFGKEPKSSKIYGAPTPTQ